MNRTQENELWVFGYGSLCWYPGFLYTRSTTGYVRGFSRRFWQGNTTHRGTIEKVSQIVLLHFSLYSSLICRISPCRIGFTQSVSKNLCIRLMKKETNSFSRDKNAFKFLHDHLFDLFFVITKADGFRVISCLTNNRNNEFILENVASVISTR